MNRPINQFSMQPTKDGAYITINVLRTNWKDAIEKINEHVKEMNEIYNQMSKDRDPIEDWKEEQRRIEMIKKEKENASKT